MGCCGLDTIGGSPSGGGGAAGFQGATWEIDFSTEASRALATGVESIGGVDWTVSVNAADSLGLLNGAGLQMAAGLISTTFTTSLQTATHLYVPLSTVYTQLDCDGTADLYVEIYASDIDIPDNGNTVGVYLYGVSGTPSSFASRMQGSLIQRGVGVLIWKTQVNTSFGPNLVVSPDAWGLKSVGIGITEGYADTYGPGWPDRWNVGIMNGGTQAHGFSSTRHPESRLAIAFPTGSTAGGMAVTIERIRARAYQAVVA